MTHKDNRNWRIYNEKLVRRGEFYLSFEFLENWNQELAIMNRGKRGRPFEYPEAFAVREFQVMAKGGPQKGFSLQ